MSTGNPKAAVVDTHQTLDERSHRQEVVSRCDPIQDLMTVLEGKVLVQAPTTARHLAQVQEVTNSLVDQMLVVRKLHRLVKIDHSRPVWTSGSQRLQMTVTESSGVPCRIEHQTAVLRYLVLATVPQRRLSVGRQARCRLLTLVATAIHHALQVDPMSHQVLLADSEAILCLQGRTPMPHHHLHDHSHQTHKDLVLRLRSPRRWILPSR